ncbi:hypothetical protein QYM36_018897, partial [Artemia franciscana]
MDDEQHRSLDRTNEEDFVSSGSSVSRTQTEIEAMLVPQLLAAASVGFGNNVLMITVGRLLCGVGGGVTSVAAPVYIGEIATPSQRGLLGSSFQLMLVTGMLLGYLLVHLYPGGGCQFFLDLSFNLYDSHDSCSGKSVYLVLRSDENGAKRALKWLRGKDYCITTELEEIQNSVAKQNIGSLTFRELSKPSILKPFTICVFLMFFSQFTGTNAIVFNLNVIFEASGGKMDSNTQSCIVGVVQVAATIISSILSDRAGRKTLLILSAFAMVICLIVLGVFFYLQKNDPALATSIGWLPLVSLMIYVTFFSIGFGPIPWAIMGELLP